MGIKPAKPPIKRSPYSSIVRPDVCVGNKPKNPPPSGGSNVTSVDIEGSSSMGYRSYPAPPPPSPPRRSKSEIKETIEAHPILEGVSRYLMGGNPTYFDLERENIELKEKIELLNEESAKAISELAQQVEDFRPEPGVNPVIHWSNYGYIAVHIKTWNRMKEYSRLCQFLGMALFCSICLILRLFLFGH